MSLEQVSGTSLAYHLIAFDKDGHERTDDPEGGVFSKRVLSELGAQPVTDVFLLSHGWKGDITAAKDQYNHWISAMLTCPDDIARMRTLRPTFRPMLIGLHWPSLPFGNEEFGGGAASFDAAAVPDLESLIQEYAERIADTPEARAALRTIFDAALVDSAPATLPPEVVAAYQTLDQESGMGAEGEGAAPGADREPFDPETAYQNARASADDDVVSFGGFSLSGLLAPLQQLSFWRMKDRARTFGESGGHSLLLRIQNSAPNARVHLMGHSFGCIVMSASIAGPNGMGTLPRPVDTLFLVQGALSLWSYCSKIDLAGNAAGYFRSVLSSNKISGVILATTSEFDTAVKRFYPLGAGVARQVTFAPSELPKYGGIGTFGIQGPDTNAESLDILPVDKSYGFKVKGVYNLNANDVVCNGGGASGAHSDITHPELAHAYFEAILARG
jgi:hypothetical protein